MCGGGGGCSERVRHLGFLLRNVLFYDAYVETPVCCKNKYIINRAMGRPL